MYLHSYVVYASIVVYVYSVIGQNVHPNTLPAGISRFHDAVCWYFASYVKDM